MPDCAIVVELRRACHCFQVSVSRDSFLGAGATGLVWSAIPNVTTASLSVDSAGSPSAARNHTPSFLVLKIAVGAQRMSELRLEHDAYCCYR